MTAQPNSDNSLSITESLDHGEHKEVVFQLTKTVRASLSMVSEGSNIRFRSILELWQGGERRYKVNGTAVVLPGTYDVRLPLALTPYTHSALVITDESTQEHVLNVPVGHVTVHYQNPDGSPIERTRLFITRQTDDGFKSDGIKRSEDRIPLTPGRYRLRGWSKHGEFDDLFFDIALGDDKTVIHRAKSQ